MEIREIKGRAERTLNFERAAVSADARTVELALSSETPYERWYGMEILGHGPGEVDLSRLLNGAALLMDHNSRDQVGVVESARLDSDRVLRCLVRFGKSARAEEIWQDVQDGIRSKVSVGYLTSDYQMTKGANGAPDVYRFTGWTPLEASIVSVPADDTVGVGRSAEGHAPAIPPTTPAAPAGTAKESSMTPEEIAAAQKAAEDIKNATAAALRAERSEALQLQQIAERNGLGKEAREMLASDKPLAEVRSELLKLVAERSATPMPSPIVQMSEREAKAYSYARAILNNALRMEGAKAEHCFEDEVSETIIKGLSKDHKRNGGFFVPLSLRAAGSTLDSITANAGTETKFTEYGGELIDLLRNFTTVIQSGARIYNGLQGSVTFPKITSDATVGWVAENPGSDLSATAPQFGTVTLSAKTMAGAIPYSRQLLAQSVIAIEAEVRRNLAVGHALALDKAALHGTGANNQPTGIYRTTGVNTKAMGGVPTYGKLQDMITEVDIDNALMDALAWVTTPGMAGKLAQTLEESSAGSDHIWKGKRRGGEMCGYLANSTNQVSALMSTLVDSGGSQHGIIFGNWADLMIGFWGAMELVIDPYTLKKQALIEVASFQMADLAIRHAGSFCVSTGATLS